MKRRTKMNSAAISEIKRAVSLAKLVETVSGPSRNTAESSSLFARLTARTRPRSGSMQTTITASGAASTATSSTG